MRGLQFTGIIASTFLVAACGGEATKVVAPDSAPPALGALTIAGADAILTGAPSGYVATGTFTDGRTASVPATWRTSNPAVATVDGSGRVEGLTHGSVELIASYQGRDVSKTVQVVSNYSGRWQGEYRVSSCKDDGDLSNHDGGWCNTVYVPGRVYRIIVDITQDPADLTSVSAKLTDEIYRGSVGSDGGLTVAGVNDVFDWDRENVIAIREIHWNASLSPAGGIAGRFREDYRSIFFRMGTAHMEYELVTLTRASGASAAY